MRTRPDYVSVIGYFLAIVGFLGLLRSLFSIGASSDLPSYLTGGTNVVGTTVGGIGCVIFLVAGINILTGHNWARWLYVGSCAALFIFDLLFLFDKFYMLVPATVVRLITIAFLFMPGANRYFRESSRW